MRHYISTVSSRENLLRNNSHAKPFSLSSSSGGASLECLGEKTSQSRCVRILCVIFLCAAHGAGMLCSRAKIRRGLPAVSSKPPYQAPCQNRRTRHQAPSTKHHAPGTLPSVSAEGRFCVFCGQSPLCSPPWAFSTTEHTETAFGGH